MDSKDRIGAKDCIHLANDIIISRKLLIPRLTSVKEINYSFFLMVFDDIFELDFPQILKIEPKNKSQEVKLMARLLSFVSNDLFAVSLDHIKAEEIIDRNVNSIHDLLEIICTFVKYIPHRFDKTQDIKLESKSVTKCVQTGFSSDNDSFDSKLMFHKMDYISSRTSSSSKTLSESSLTEDRLEMKQKLPIQPKNEINFNIDSHGKKITSNSKAIQTDVFVVKTIDESHENIDSKNISIDEYKRLKYENFVAVLGNRFHEMLKLKEITDNLELRIKKYFGDVTAKSPQRRNKSPSKTVRKQIKKIKTPLKIKSTNKMIHQNKNQKVSSLDHLLKTFPEIPENTIKKLKEEENRQKKIIENLNKEITINQTKVKSKLKEAIDRQEKKFDIIGNEVKQMQTFEAIKESKAKRMRENAAKRDSRIERARIKKMIDKFQNELNSKYKRLQSIEETIVSKEFENRIKEENECINEFRKRIKEKHSLELEKQKRIIESIDNLYRNKYEMIYQNIEQEEKRLRDEIASQTQYLRSIKKEIDQKMASTLNNQFKA